MTDISFSLSLFATAINHASARLAVNATYQGLQESLQQIAWVIGEARKQNLISVEARLSLFEAMAQTEAVDRELRDLPDPAPKEGQ